MTLKTKPDDVITGHSLSEDSDSVFVLSMDSTEGSSSSMCSGTVTSLPGISYFSSSGFALSCSIISSSFGISIPVQTITVSNRSFTVSCASVGKTGVIFRIRISFLTTSAARSLASSRSVGTSGTVRSCFCSGVSFVTGSCRMTPSLR